MKKFILLLFLIFILTGCQTPLGDVPPIPDIALEKVQGKYNQSTKIKQEYKLEKTAFIKEAKDENAIQTEVGDKTKDEFEPSLTLRKWDDEVSFKVKANLQGIAKKDRKLILEDNKIKLKTQKKEYHFYRIEKGYEFEIVLLEKPTSNVISLDIELKGLDCFYQPELTQEEKDEGAFRPIEIIGSYACYHSTKQGDYSKMGLKNYMAGKAFHIYRPRIIDNIGKEVWGELNIDVENKFLTVKIPQEFLNNAVYPIRHASGLTFGETGVGGSQIGAPANWLMSYLHTSPSGTNQADSISLYARPLDSSAIDQNIKGVLVLHSNLNIVTNGVSGVMTFTNYISPNWEIGSFSTPPSLTASTDYCIGFVNEDGDYRGYYDSGDADTEHADTTNSYSSPTDPTDLNWHQTNNLSIYVTYSAEGGGEEELRYIRNPIFFD